MEKLFIITTAEYGKSYIIPQSVHAAVQFMMEHPLKAKLWHYSNNTVICLKAENHNDLYEIIVKLIELNIDISVFKEPDKGNKITSISFIGNEKNREITKKLSLA